MIRSKQKIRMGLTLKVLEKDGLMHTYRRRSLKAFLNLCRGCAIGDRYEIKLTYYPKIINEGEYETKEEMLFAVKAFTNSDELDFVEKYWRESMGK